MLKAEYGKCFDKLYETFPSSDITLLDNMLFIDVKTKKALLKLTLCEAYFMINKVVDGYQRTIKETTSADKRDLKNAMIFIEAFYEEYQKYN